MHGMFCRLNKPISEEAQLEILLHNIRPCYANTLAAAPASSIKTIENLRSVCLSYETVKSRFSNFREPPKISSTTIAPEFSYKPKSPTTNYNKNDFNKRFDQPKPSTSYYGNTFKFNKKYSNPDKYNFGSNSNGQKMEVAALSSQSPGTVFCPRCRSDNHSLRNCRQDRFPICFKCGKRDVIYPDCTDCHPRPTDEPSKN